MNKIQDFLIDKLSNDIDTDYIYGILDILGKETTILSEDLCVLETRTNDFLIKSSLSKDIFSFIVYDKDNKLVVSKEFSFTKYGSQTEYMKSVLEFLFEYVNNKPLFKVTCSCGKELTLSKMTKDSLPEYNGEDEGYFLGKGEDRSVSMVATHDTLYMSCSSCGNVGWMFT